MNPSEKPPFRQVALIAFASTLGPFAVNGYVPGFHAMGAEFGLPLESLQLTLTAYLIAFSSASMVVGAISDAVGRRKVLVGGMLLFAFATVGAMLSHGLIELLLWRFLQGCGACVGQVVTQAIVRDRWRGAAATGVTSIIGTLFALSPAVAPVVGGWITVLAGWRSVFWFLLAYSLAIAAAGTFLIRESLPAERRRAFNAHNLFSGYRACLSCKAFLAGILSNGLSFMGGILCVAGAADYVVNIMGCGIAGFAWLTVPLVVSSMVGASLAPRLAQRFGPVELVLGAVTLLTAIEALLALLFGLGASGYALLVAAPAAFQFTMNLIRPVVMVMNLDYHPGMRGLATSIQQAFLTLGYVMSTTFLAPLCFGAAWKYALAMVLAAVLTGAAWKISVRNRPAALAPLKASEK